MTKESPKSISIGSGIGRLMALRFSRLGANLVLVDVNEKGNQETLDMIKNRGGQAHAYTCDLSLRNQVYDMGEKVTWETHFYHSRSKIEP